MLWLCYGISGVYLSGSMSSFQNMVLLYLINSSIGTFASSSWCYRSMFQNFRGWYFRMSGRVNYICALANLHCRLYSWYAASVSLCFLPLLSLHFLYTRFASLQMLLYHGAKCFAHLFGFAAIYFVCLLATPISNALSIRNCSMRADLASLSPWFCYITCSIASSKTLDAVYSCHFVALSIYLSPSPAPTHSIVSFSRAGVVLLMTGWCVLVEAVEVPSGCGVLVGWIELSI